MSINATLIGQMLTFLLFVWFTMRFVWPPLNIALEARKEKIATGLAAAEEGEQKLIQARHEAEKLRHDAQIQAHQILEQAEKRKLQILEQARVHAQTLHENILKDGRLRIKEETQQAKQHLESQLIELLGSTCLKLLGREIKVQDHKALLGQFGV
ncbi:MAG: F0F1 ATP synthase subunit B [Gammaproteobacteria bacterium]